MRIGILGSDHFPEIAAAIQLAEMEVFDFSVDGAAGDAYVLAADSEIDLLPAQELINFFREQTSQGKPLLGLGYGAAKLLADGGLVPGLYQHMAGLRVKARCHPASSCAQDEREREGTQAWVRLMEDYQLNAFTLGLSPSTILPLPQKTAAEFIIPPGLLAEMQAQGQTVFLYCEASGSLAPGNAIAAVSDKAGRVLALLAQPETLALAELFKALKKHLELGYSEQVEPLYYWPRS